MQRLVTTLMCFLGFLTVVNAAHAVDETYMGFQVAGLEVEPDSTNESVDPSMLIGRLGGTTGNGLLFEGRVGTGLSDDTSGTGGNQLTVDVRYLVGGYGILRGNVSETLFPYLIAGGTLLDLDAPGDAKVDGTETSLSYGVGFDARVSQSLSFGIEYMRYVDSGAFDLDALSIGITGRF